MPPLRPAAVSIHDDGNMLRKTVGIQIKEQPLFLQIGGLERIRYFHAIIPESCMERPEALARAYGKANIGSLTAQHDSRSGGGKTATTARHAVNYPAVPGMACGWMTVA